MPYVMQDVQVTSYQVGGADGGARPVEDGSSSLAASTASFDGRLLTARELKDEQARGAGETTLGDIVVVRELDDPTHAMDLAADGTVDAHGGGVNGAFADGSVRFLADEVW